METTPTYYTNDIWETPSQHQTKRGGDRMARPGPVSGPDLSRITAALDRASLARLEEAYPELAAEVIRSVQSGATPDEIRRHALSNGEPWAIARWLAKAARAAQEL